MVTITLNVNSWGYLIIGWGYFISAWFIRDEEYFNTTLEGYKSIYLDRTSDYVTKDDFEGAQVIL